MKASVIYRHRWLYEACMFLLYLGHYRERSRVLAGFIPDHSSVVDVCCGPGTLYFDHLRKKSVRYTGLDINAGFIKTLAASGVKGVLWDMNSPEPLPRADYVVMQASLYHFLPDPRAIVDRMLVAANRQVILSEPVRNLADHNNPVLRWLARKFTNPGTGDQARRFDESSFDRFFAPYQSAGYVQAIFSIAGNREKVCVLRSRFNDD